MSMWGYLIEYLNLGCILNQAMKTNDDQDLTYLLWLWGLGLSSQSLF